MRNKANWLGLPKRITALIEGESDRGAVLILGSYLEEILGDVIESNCLAQDLADDLLELRGPAGDFDSKVRLAVAIGLVHRLEAKALHCVRKIRNRAAHFDFNDQGAESPFASNSTIDLVSNLAGFVNLTLPNREPSTVRDVFVMASRLVAIRLMGRALEAQKRPEPKTMNEIAANHRAKMKDTPLGAVFEDAEKSLREGDPSKMQEVVKAMGEAIKQRFGLSTLDGDSV